MLDSRLSSIDWRRTCGPKLEAGKLRVGESGRTYLVLPVIRKSSCKQLGLGKRSQQAKVLGEPATLTFDIRQQFAQKVPRGRTGAIHDRADLEIISAPCHPTDHASYALTQRRQARLRRSWCCSLWRSIVRLFNWGMLRGELPFLRHAH
jgi:hypothetical protein